MTTIYESKDLPEREVVYLKKDWLGWRVVEPITDPITKKVNYLRLLFGSRRTIFTTAIILGLVALFFLGFQEVVSYYQKQLEACGKILLP